MATEFNQAEALNTSAELESSGTQKTFFESEFFLNYEKWNSRDNRKKTIIHVEIYDKNLCKNIFSCCNISESGMAIIGNNSFEIGDEVFIFIREKIKIAGSIVWVKNRKCGVKFYKKINFISTFGPNFNLES